MNALQGLLFCLMVVCLTQTIFSFARWRYRRLPAEKRSQGLHRDWQVQLLTRTLSLASLGLIVYLVAAG